MYDKVGHRPPSFDFTAQESGSKIRLITVLLFYGALPTLALVWAVFSKSRAARRLLAFFGALGLALVVSVFYASIDCVASGTIFKDCNTLSPEVVHKINTAQWLLLIQQPFFLFLFLIAGALEQWTRGRKD